MKNYDLKELMAVVEKKLRANGEIDANGQITPKGFEKFMKQWRAWKAKKP